MRCVGNNILVRPDPLPSRTRGGLIIPGDAVEDLQNTGTVLAVGRVATTRGAERVGIPGLKPGDRVSYLRFLEKQDSNTQIQHRLGDNIISIRPADVQLVFDEEDLPKMRPDLFGAVQEK